jgi:hypothetical protein
VDDGTGIIECIVKYPKTEEPPPPISEVGNTIRVVGKVTQTKRAVREIICSLIGTLDV